MNFFSGPSAFARVGAVVLLVGVGLLLKYAAEEGLLDLRLRLWSVVVGALGLLGVGWRLRRSRPAYSVALMGTAFGLWYVTGFAALRFYALLPQGVAFALLALLGLGLGGVAAVQRSQVLAVLGSLGGFLAPVLTSGGAGESSGGTQLLAYYTLVNLLTLPLGARFGWSGLPTLGFVATFGVGGAWGALSGSRLAFWSVEPFLALFFLMYALLPLAEARFGRSRPGGNVVGLLFLTPLVCLGLQAGLLGGDRAGIAITCLVLAAFYGVLAQRSPLWRGPHTALSVTSGTLAVPFALGANLTSAAWGLEGAALAWYAHRSAGRSWALWSAALQVLAALAVLGHVLFSKPGALEGWGLAALLAGASVLSARWLRAQAPVLSWALAGWGLVVWLLGGAYALLYLDLSLLGTALFVVYVAASALLLSWLGARWQLPALRWAALLPVPLALLTLPVWLGGQPLADLGWLATFTAVAAQLTLLEGAPFAFPARSRLTYHALTLWYLALVLAWSVSAWLDGRFAGQWSLCAWGAVPALALAALLTRGRALPWLRRDFGGYVRRALLPVLGFALLWFWIANLGPADSRPLPTLPLLNGLDLTLAGVWLVAWSMLSRAGAGRVPGLAQAMQPVWRQFPPRAVPWLLGLSALAWASLAALRGVSALLAVPWDAQALLSSGAAQAALTLTWTALGMGAMLWATRRGVREVWLSGAGLLGVVTVKLFVVDLSGSSPLARIVSFVSVGALLLLTGYLSPVPPREGSEQAR